MRVLGLFVALLLSSPASADTKEECAKLKSYRFAYAFCLAQLEDDDKCPQVGDDVFKAHCLALARGNTTSCTSLDEAPKQACTAMARRKYSDCTAKAGTKEQIAWCKAMSSLNDTFCSATGGVKTDCNRIITTVEDALEERKVTVLATADVSLAAEEVADKVLPSSVGSGVVFGLSGKNEAAITTAVAAGYRIFDAADTYGGTATVLAKVLRAAKVPRRDFEIIYKIDATAPEALEGHIRTLAGRFGGYLDHVIIHKSYGDDTAAYKVVLKKLKDARFIIKVGGGDVSADMDDVDTADSFELDASTLLFTDEGDRLVEKLEESDKPIFVYNLVDAATRIYGDRPTRSQLKLLISKIKSMLPSARPILSSSDEGRMRANLASSGEMGDGDYEDYGDMSSGIDEQRKIVSRAVPMGEMDGDVQEALYAVTLARDYSEPYLFNADSETEIRECLVARSRAMATFTREQLGATYVAASGKAYKLSALLAMLFQPGGNCHRVEAFNAIMDADVPAQCSADDR